MTLYGEAFFIVSLLPNSRSSGLTVSLFHLITFYSSQLLATSTNSALKYSMSLLPNVCLNQMMQIIIFYNFNTTEGLTFSSAGNDYDGFSFKGGLAMLLVDIIIWAFIGTYLDQVIPSEYGIAKPWNFMCIRKKARVAAHSDSATQSLIHDNENVRKNPQNFEPVTDKLKKQEANNDCLVVRGLVKKFG